MSAQAKASLAHDLEGFYLPRLRDIPDVGLMLEQTARLVTGYLEPLGSVSLTSSMVSNYVKQGIIDRPIKKLYYRQQIADLIFIALAKTVLQLDDIHGILTLARKGDPADLYTTFCGLFEASIEDAEEEGNHPKKTTSDKAVDEMLRKIAVTCVHQIRLERFVHATLETTR